MGAPEPLFARIDADKILAELAAEKEAAAKAAEASAKAGNAAGIVSLPQIGIEDFARVELRVARVTACEPVKKGQKAAQANPGRRQRHAPHCVFRHRQVVQAGGPHRQTGGAGGQPQARGALRGGEPG